MFDYSVLDQMSDYTAPAVGALNRVTRYSFNLDKQLTRVTRSDGATLDYSYDAAGKLSILQLSSGNYLYNYAPATSQLASIATPSGDVLGYAYDGNLPTGQTWSGGINGNVSLAYNGDFSVASIAVNGSAINLSYDRDNLLTGIGTLGIGRDDGNGRIVTTSQGTMLTEHYQTEFGEFWGIDVSVDRSGSAAVPAESINNDLQQVSELMEIIWPAVFEWGADLQDRYCESSLITAVDAASGLSGNVDTFESAVNTFASCFHSSYFTLSMNEAGVSIQRVQVDTVLADIGQQIDLIRNPNTDDRDYVYSDWPEYDQLGRIITLKDWFEGEADWRQMDYQYDTSDRLTQVSINGTPTENYSYDLNGNRLAANGQSATYDAQDRLTSFGGINYTYTANGELSSKTDGSQTTQYTYDVLGNLLSVQLPDSRTIGYVIDGQNRRVGKRINGVLTQGFLYQSQLQIAAELDGASNFISRFVYGTKANVPDYMVKGGVTYRIISDHLGSPRLVINADTGAAIQRMDYDAFGNVINDTNPGFQPFGFAGGLYDRDTKLVRFGARDYDPQAGRWTAKDSLLFMGGDTNFYGYALQDPVNFLDPNGKWIVPAISCAVGGIGGYIAGREYQKYRDKVKADRYDRDHRSDSPSCDMPGGNSDDADLGNPDQPLLDGIEDLNGFLDKFGKQSAAVLSAAALLSVSGKVGGLVGPACGVVGAVIGSVLP